MKVFLLAVLLLWPQADSAEFTISLNGLRVGTEEFSVLRRGDGFLATGRTELRVGGGTVVARSRMELDGDLNPVSYQYDSGDQTIRIDIDGQETRVDITVAGALTSYNVSFPPGGMIVDDNFFHHYALLLNRLGESGGTVPVFVPQQLTVGTLEVVPRAELSYDLTTESLRLTATMDEAGRLIRIAGVDANVVVER